MAKDPAMLWYWSDWHSGTTTFSRFLKGCYMDVLHAQFNSGHLLLEEIKTVLGSDFGQAWPALQKKFTVDTAGKYFNVRLEQEQIKRQNYTASRKNNLQKTPHMDTHMDQHMKPHMENVNEDVNGIEVKDGVKGKENVPRATIDINSDESIAMIFDEKTMDGYRFAFRNIDIDAELKNFIVKIRGAPDDYKYRDTGGIRNAFHFQLRTAKPEKNHGTSTTKQNQSNNSRVKNPTATSFGTL